MEESSQISLRHVIRDEQLLVLGEVVSAQRDEILVPQSSESFNMALEILPFSCDVLEALHHQYDGLAQVGSIGVSHAALAESLSRRS